jgi:hypothetical protein
MEDRMIGMYWPHIVDGLIALAIVGIAIWAITNGRGVGWSVLLVHGALRAISSVMRYFHTSHLMAHETASLSTWATVSSAIYYLNVLLLLIALILIARPTSEAR